LETKANGWTISAFNGSLPDVAVFDVEGAETGHVGKWISERIAASTCAR